MARIRVDTSGVAELRSVVGTVNAHAGSAQAIISQARGGIDMKTAASENVSYRINNLYSRLRAQQDKLRQYESALTNVNERFLASDRIVANQAKEINYLAKQIVDSPYSATRETLTITAQTAEVTNLISTFSKQGEGICDYLWTVLKKAGHFGAFFSMASGIANLSDPTKPPAPKAKIAAVKNIKSFVNNLSDDILKMTKAKRIMHPSTYRAAWAKRIFGATDYFKNVGGISKSTNFSTRWYNNFQKAKGKEISKVTWAGVALDGVFNALDNYDEYQRGEISGFRAYAETISETGIDIALNGLLTTAVAATLGATIGAPAVAVAAGTLAAKVLLDGVAKWATGGEKDFTEAVSDWVLDTGKGIIERKIEQIQKIGQGIASVANNISAGWQALIQRDKVAPMGSTKSGFATARWST